MEILLVGSLILHFYVAMGVTELNKQPILSDSNGIRTHNHLVLSSYIHSKTRTWYDNNIQYNQY